MANEEWGVKRLCPESGKRFYDLNRDPIISPYTGKVIELEPEKNKTIMSDKDDVRGEQKEDILVDDADDILGEDGESGDVDLDDDVLADDDDDTVPLDDLADIAADDEND